MQHVKYTWGTIHPTPMDRGGWDPYPTFLDWEIWLFFKAFQNIIRAGAIWTAGGNLIPEGWHHNRKGVQHLE